MRFSKLGAFMTKPEGNLCDEMRVDMDKEKEIVDFESQTAITEGTGKSEVQEKRVLIRIPIRHNPRLQQIIDRINQDDELYTI